MADFVLVNLLILAVAVFLPLTVFLAMGTMFVLRVKKDLARTATIKRNFGVLSPYRPTLEFILSYLTLLSRKEITKILDQKMAEGYIQITIDSTIMVINGLLEGIESRVDKTHGVLGRLDDVTIEALTSINYQKLTGISIAEKLSGTQWQSLLEGLLKNVLTENRKVSITLTPAGLVISPIVNNRAAYNFTVRALANPQNNTQIDPLTKLESVG